MRVYEGIYYLLSFFFFSFFLFFAFFAGYFFFLYYWLFLTCYFSFIFVIIPLFIKFSLLGSPLFVYQPFLRSYISFLRGKLEFLIDIPSKYIIFFCLGSFRATLLNLNNLFLAFLFIRFVCLIPYLFENKVVVFQPFYFVIFFMEGFWFDYIISLLYFVALFYNFILLFGFLFIYSPMPLYRLIFEVIWSFSSIFCYSRHIFAYFLSSVSAFMLYFLP